MDDEERMNLVLNTDFDMALLDCWEETQKADEAGKVEETPTPTEVRGAVNWESQKLPSFLIEPDRVGSKVETRCHSVESQRLYRGIDRTSRCLH